MEEKILVKSGLKNVFMVCLAISLSGILLCLLYLLFSANQYIKDAYSYSGSVVSYFDGIKSTLKYDGAFMVFEILAVVLLIVGIVLYKRWSKVEMVITDKRVYGINASGKRVDLPLDSISAISTYGLFSGLAITTASGAIKFVMIKNRSEIYDVVSKLLVERQNKTTITSITQEVSQSGADELKKYKDLLDSGIISQEEFEAKKKQLLNL